MTEAVDQNRIVAELKAIREDVNFIKKHMFDPDTMLTTEEARIFEQSMKELEEGKTKSISAIKRELGI